MRVRSCRGEAVSPRRLHPQRGVRLPYDKEGRSSLAIGRQRFGRVNVYQRPIVPGFDFANALAELCEEVLGADIAFDGENLGKETPREEDRVAVLSFPRGDTNRTIL